MQIAMFPEYQSEEPRIRREAILERFLVSAKGYLAGNHWDEGIQGFLASLGEAAHASWIAIFENETGMDEIPRAVCRYEWIAPGQESRFSFEDAKPVPFQEIGSEGWVKALASGEIIQGETNGFPKDKAEVAEEQASRYRVVLPLIVENRWWGFIVIDEMSGEPGWNPSELITLKTVVEMIGTTIQKKNYKERSLDYGESYWQSLGLSPTSIFSVLDGPDQENAEEALHRQLKELSVLHAVAIASAEASDVDSLIERATQIIGEAFYPDNFGLLLLDDKNHCLLPHDSYRTRQGVNNVAMVSLGQGIVGKVAMDGKPLRVADVTQEPAYFKVDELTKSELCVPLKIEERVIGVINAESGHLEAFTAEDERLLVTLAGQLSTAIDRMRAESINRHRSEQLATLYRASQEGVASLEPNQVYEAIHQAAAQLVPTDAFVITLLDETHQKILPTYLMDQGKPVKADPILTQDGISGYVIATGEALLINDPQKFEGMNIVWAGEDDTVKSILAVPLRLGDKTFGMLSCQSYKSDAFSSEDLQTLSTLANQAAFAIGNAQLFKETHRHAQQLSIINELAREMTSIFDIDKLCKTVTQRLYQTFGYFNVSIFTVDERTHEVVLQAIARPRGLAQPGNYRQAIEKGIIGRAVTSGLTELVNDTCQDPDFFQFKGKSVASELVIPLKVGDRVVGVLNIDSDRLNAYDQSDVEMLTTVADQFAVTLENARLFEETQRRLQEVTFLSQIIAITATEKDLSSAFKTVCAELANFFQVPESSFGLINSQQTFVQVIAEYVEPDRPSGLGNIIPTFDEEAGINLFEHKGSVVITADRTDQDLPMIREFMQQREISSLLIVPILFGGDVVGSLQIADVKPRNFLQSEIDLVEKAASQVSQAVERLALFAATSEQADLMGTLASLSETLNRPLSVGEVIEEIGQGAMVLGSANRAAVYFRKGDNEATCRWSYGLSEAYLREVLAQIKELPGGKLLRNAEVILIQDVNKLEPDSLLLKLSRSEGYKAIGFWPLVYENQVIAAIGCHYDEVHNWSDAEQEVLMAFARQAAVALQNARLFDETRRRARHLEALNSIITAVAAASDLQSLLEVALEHILKALGLESGGIWVANQSVIRGIPEDIGDKIAEVHLPIEPEVSNTKAIEDWEKLEEKDPLSKYAPIIASFGLRATLTVAILSEDTRIGGISVASSQPREWNREEVALLEGVGRQLGGAVERIELLEKIQVHARQIQQIMDSVPEGVLLLDERKCLVLANPAGQEYLTVLGCERSEECLSQLSGKSLDEVFAVDSVGLWHEFVTTDTIRKVFEITAQPLIAGEHPGGWVLVLRDVTHDRETQTRIQMQERLATVGQLAAGIAHDFNNILAAIIVYADLLRRDTNLPMASRERIGIIQQQVQRAASLIRQILDFSRRSVMEQSTLDLLPFVKELDKLLQRVLPETIRVELDYKPGEYRVRADPTRLQQVFMNLAVNARDAMPEGGNLHIELDRLCLKEGEQSSCPDLPSGKWIRMAVRDDGEGISPEAIPHIFEPFFTTKPVGQGTGLGLAQAYGIIKQHDGYIGVHSQPGDGTTFHIYLPPLMTDDDDDELLESETGIEGQGETILVVEDDPFAREAMKDLLEASNYHVVLASDGLEAMHIYERQGQRIALVVSDMVMPEMGGVALYRSLQERWPMVKVLFITGHPLREDDQALLERNEVRWMQKPFSVQAFSEMVRKMLSE
jgi:GAF domain-containing protein/signal transduction histidine kinase/CheY-like chemotaxis protein